MFIVTALSLFIATSLLSFVITTVSFESLTLRNLILSAGKPSSESTLSTASVCALSSAAALAGLRGILLSGIVLPGCSIRISSALTVTLTGHLCGLWPFSLSCLPAESLCVSKRLEISFLTSPARSAPCS